MRAALAAHDSSRRTCTLLAAARFATFLGAGLLAAPQVQAQSSPAGEALNETRAERKPYNVVQNRFFLKGNRFEITPIAGYVPNNPMVKRYVGGLLAAYHFSEIFAAEGAFVYAPDLGSNDLKDLTHTLVTIAEQGSGDVGFQQPLDKLILGATFAARWAPVYGKINLIGERVLNFDFYGVAGLGMLSLQSYYAVYDDSAAEGVAPTVLNANRRKATVTPNVGFGLDFFLSSSIAVKLDARSYLYVDKKPQYDPDTPVTESRLYNNFVASVGVSVFLPRMKPRLYEF